MAKLHKHMIVQAAVNKPPVKEDERMIEQWLNNIVGLMGMEILKEASAAYCEQIGNRGMTATVLITTSHMALHTWDEEEKFIEFDVYTCSELDPEMVLEQIQIFEPTKISWKYLDRYNGLTLIDQGER